MFGYFDGERSDPMERANSEKPSSARSKLSPTETSALKAAQALRIDANQQTPHTEGGPKTIAELIAHYRLKELAGESKDARRFRRELDTKAI